MPPAIPPCAARWLVLAVALGFGAAPAFAREPAEAASEQRAGKARTAPGQFSANDLPAERDGAALLTIPAAGRYSLRAKSASGARIELIDMIAGPLDSAGAAGLRDGRIDALLDKGVYKLRVTNAKGAAGKVALSAEPFVEADAKRPALAPGQIQSAELGDLAQRSYSLEVGPSGRVGVEAIGRALRDLRLWRADGELMDAAFEMAQAEPRAGHVMTRARLEANVAPGRYVVTAYGGERLIWADAAAAQPLLVRLDEPALLAAAVAEGVIGPFGAARFEAPAEYDSFRLELPDPAGARLDARRGATRQSAIIDKRSREPAVSVSLAADGSAPVRLEASGFEGQSFSLRALRQDSRRSFEASGPHLVSVDLAGEGGDEVPATALFARVEKDGRTRVVASDMPRVAAGRSWRGKFNLRGTTTLLFEATNGGPVAVDVKGVKVRASVEPALGSLAPRAGARDPLRYDLQAGFYQLTLQPVGDAAGVVDVTLGPPGLSAPLPSPPPSRAAISFGEHKLEGDGSYLVLVNTAPDLLAGARIVSLPVELEKAPLALQQPAGAELAVPLRLPKTGAAIARDSKGAEIAVTLADEKIENDVRFVTAKIAPAAGARALGLIFVPEAAKSDEAAKSEDAGKAKPARAPPPAAVGKPAFFDIARDETKYAPFSVAQGGLYRIETLGRLQTALAVGTSFAPRLGQSENNGPGHNALVSAYLRAGGYRAAVTAKESEGRVGVSVTPAALRTTAKLEGEGVARATLDAGAGALVPFDIPQGGVYRIDLLGVTREWSARLEDAEGWPLAAPGKLTRLTRRFEKGSYRLVVLPQDVEARMVARLAPVVAPAPLEGHGPHDLRFGEPRKLQWREPADRAAPRAPDVWRFALSGDANVEIAIGEGMVGEIVKGERESVGQSVGKVVGAKKFEARLSAGVYRIEARSLAHDDRLDYEISLDAKELQPGAPRYVDLPAKLAFSLAADRVVDLTAFGDVEMLGALKDANGAVIEWLQGRADDWNVALSRRLPAGAYTLELEPLGVNPRPASEATGAEEGEDEDEGEEDGADDAAAPGEEENAPGDEPRPRGVEIRFALPAETNDGALEARGVRTLAGQGAHFVAHVATLPPAPEGSLALVAAQSQVEVALSIERRDAGGAWRVVGTERGLAPVAAWPAEKGGKSEWRALVWSVGGGAAPIAIATRIVERRARALGDVALEAVEDAGPPVCVGLAAAPSASLVEIAPRGGTLLAGSAPGRLLRETRAGPMAPQSEALWLMTRGGCDERVAVKAFEWKGAEIALDIGAGETAVLPALAAPAGMARLWLARSAFGQPGLDAGRGFGVVSGAALALAGEKPLRLWNASGAASLRVNLRAIDVGLSPPAKGGALYAALLPPMSAQPVTLDPKDAPLAFDLSAGVAAFAAPDSSRPFSTFADDAPLSRVENGVENDIWLVNYSDKPAPARVAAEPGRSETLAAGRAIKRFFGAGGQLSLPVDAQAGDHVVVTGGEATFVSEAGLVARGETLTLDGRGRVVVDYKPGLVAVWLERAGKSPWPAAAPRAVATPQRVALVGEAMSFTLKQAAPVMLNARTNAPAIVAFTQYGRREVKTYAAGVELHRYMGAGEGTLDVYSPHDGALSGMLDIGAQPVIEAQEGINPPIAISPGAGALFAFEVKREGEIGIGVRAEPDRVGVRLLDAAGKTLGEGVAQSMKLAPGRYLVEVRAPPDAGAGVLRLAVVGVSPPPAGPPPEVVAEFLEKAGLKTVKTR